MHSESSIATRLFACLVVATLLGAAATSIAAGASGAGSVLTSSASLESDDGTIETDESIDSAFDGSTEAVENTTDSTTDDLENTTDSTTDGATDGTETGDTVDETVSTTTDTVDGTVSTTTDTVDETTATVDETGIDGSLETESETGTQDSSAGGNGSSDDNAGRVTSSDGGRTGSDSPTTAGDAETAGDVVLVGMLGAITASGAAAGGAGASGVAGSASTATASWLRTISETDGLRRAGADYWKVLALFRYSQYDDSDPLEHDRRRAIYETIEAEPGSYLSQLSDDTEVPLSTVRHHVRILEEEGLITTSKHTGKRRYFREGADAELQAALAEPAKRDVLEALAALGRAHNGRLADELERDPSTVSHHLAGLEDDGLVVRERDGRSIVNELPPRVEAALGGDPPPTGDAEPALADD
jgi:DNA-binding transcriptional ArsR family regulator